MLNTKNKIILTGGHAATTAAAVIDEIHSQKLSWKLYWIGSKYAVEGKKALTLEYKVLPDRGVEFLPLVMGRLQTRFTVWTIPSLLKIPVGFVQAFYYLLKIQPNEVLSFGGFSAYPVAFAAKILGIPLIIHEQTAAAGRANLASASFADKIALARPESRKFFENKKTVVTGNPVSEKAFLVTKPSKLPAVPTIFIMGGSRGSQKINSAAGVILPKLLKKYKVIHQTGPFDIEQFEQIKSVLPADLAKNYEIFANVDPSKIINFYGKADLIISRSGANTVSEILAVGRPAILIPLSISYLDEQNENAKILVKAGAGVILRQSELSGEKLLSAITTIFSKYHEYIRKIAGINLPDKNAAENLVSLLKSYLK